MKRKSAVKTSIIVTAIILAIGIPAFLILDYYNLLPKKIYTAEHFGIETIKSAVDYNDNGVDDYMDILLGARIDVENNPKYDGAYHAGGYPPDDIGVCTDVVWRAFKNAGYSLKDMVDKDITNRPEAYPEIKIQDKNIDFRRVSNLHVFFEDNAVSLTLDIEDIKQWQPGDIVTFGYDKHVAIISDKRNRKGQPYIIHNGGQIKREEDALRRGEITGHFRFDGKVVPNELIVKWVD